MITSTPLPIQLVQAAELASFTAALSGTLSLAARSVTSAAVPVAAGKALLVSCEAVESAQFITEVSKDGGASWQVLESKQAANSAARLVRALTTDGEAFQARFTAVVVAVALTSFRVAYQLRG